MESNLNPNLDREVLLNLRRRLQDLQKTDGLNPDNFALYEQTILQLHQEAERRKQTCFTAARELRAQAVAQESQGHAFSSMASMLFAVVDGYVKIEEKRIREEQERAQERAEATAPEPASVKTTKRRSRRGAEGKPSGSDPGSTSE